MPCQDPSCSHGWKTIDFEDGSGYYAERICDPAKRVRWDSPTMIDHHEATANGVATAIFLTTFCSLCPHFVCCDETAYISLHMPFFLCQFHMDKAIAEHLSGHLLITGQEDLWALMDGMRYLARGANNSYF